MEALLLSSHCFLDVNIVKPLVNLLLIDTSVAESELPVAKRFLANKLLPSYNLQEALEVISRFNDAFSICHKMYVGAVTLGISTATCENSFLNSIARFLRPHRKSTSHSRKIDLVLLANERNLCKKINADEFLDTLRLQSRRILL